MVLIIGDKIEEDKLKQQVANGRQCTQGGGNSHAFSHYGCLPTLILLFQLVISNDQEHLNKS